MKAAGLRTVRFMPISVRKELQTAAVAYGQKVSLERARRNNKGSYADRDVSPRYQNNPGDDCTMAALGQEVARSTT